MVQLFDQIVFCFQQDITPEKKAVWKVLQGSAPYKDAQFRRYCSDLSKAAMEFLSITRFQSDPMAEYLYLLPAINDPGLNKHFAGALRQAKAVQEKLGHQNESFHFARFRFEAETLVHLGVKAIVGNNLSHLGQADYHLECYYIINKLRNYVELLMWKNIRSTDLELHLFPGFLEYIEQSKYIDEPAIAIFIRIVKTFLEPTEEKHFFQLRSLLVKA